MQTVVVAIVVAIVAVLVTLAVANKIHQDQEKAKINSAEAKAREIIDEAVRAAKSEETEAKLKIQEEKIKQKDELDKEIRERRNEVQRSENRIAQKEDSLNKKIDAQERREAELNKQEQQLNKQREEVAKLNQQRVQELERISGLTSEQAKDQLLKSVEEDVKLDVAKLIKESYAQAKDEADKKARDIVVSAIQKCSADHVAETTISVVHLLFAEARQQLPAS